MRLVGVRRIISHCHVSVVSPDAAPPEAGLRRTIKQLIHRTPLRADRRVYAVSAFVAQRLAARNCYPVSRTHVIRNGIDVDRFSCSDARRASSVLRVFVAARATRFKGVQVLIEATRLLVRRPGLPAFVVHYAGDGPDMESFRTQAREAGQDGTFVFLGALPGTLAELCAADVVVVPSVWGDAAPLAAIEGLAAGKAVIATTAGGLPEIVGGPDTGLLVPPGDPLALADAIASLLTDGSMRIAIGEKAQRRAHELYSRTVSHQAIAARVIADLGLDA